MRDIKQIPEKFRELLHICLEKQKNATLEEVDATLDMTNGFFTFNVDDFIHEYEKYTPTPKHSEEQNQNQNEQNETKQNEPKQKQTQKQEKKISRFFD